VLLPDLTSTAFIATYGYWAVAGAVGLESIGIPLPGETTLIAAAALAGATHQLNIVGVIAAASAGAIIGDSIVVWIGRTLGLRLLKRYGARIGLSEQRLKLGRYMFMRHGGKMVFFGRFIALLRALAALFAGANRMRWPKFLLFNASGGIVWATIYGLGAYYAAELLKQISGSLSWGLLALGVAGVIAGFVFLRHHEQGLIATAEQALPGPFD
jgi:membrane protein DedA with SNARE-associated domain